MSRPRGLIPLSTPLDSWPCPDLASIPENERTGFLRKTDAIQAYCLGESFAEIRAKFGIQSTEVRRYVRRCLRPNIDGTLMGFFGLLASYRAPYVRTSNDTTGLSGSLNRLLTRFPQLITLITEQVGSKPRRRKRESRIRWVDLLELHVVPWLREQKLREDEWPLCCPTHGYASFLSLFRACRVGALDGWLRKRLGSLLNQTTSAVIRPSIIPVLLSYRVVEVDYQCIDAFGLIVILTTPSGNALKLVVNRFWIGVAVEVRWQAVLACTIILEEQVSADGVLETFQDILEPRAPLIVPAGLTLTCTPDGKVFPNQLFPEYAFHGVDLIKFDNAWSNRARDVVRAAVSVFGAAVGFGAIARPKVRQTCERAIGKISQQGVQRLPSSTGSGPQDPRRSNAERKAMYFEITVDQLAFAATAAAGEVNATPNEGIHYASALELHAIATRKRESLYTPLPKGRHAETRVLWHCQEVTIRGNHSRKEQPYVKWQRARMSSTRLNDRWELLGKAALLYVNRRDSRICELVVKGSGEEIGRLTLPAKWRHTACSLRDRVLIERTGKAHRSASPRGNAVMAVLQEDVSEVANRPGKDSKKKALRIARLARNSKRQLTTDPAGPAEQEKPINSRLLDLDFEVHATRTIRR